MSRKVQKKLSGYTLDGFHECELQNGKFYLFYKMFEITMTLANFLDQLPVFPILFCSQKK